MSLQKAPVIYAAGGVLWREATTVPGAPPGREVAMVHRPRYDDWSLPKGKRKTGEELLLTGVREVTEETGHRVEVGPYLGQYSYEVTSTGRQAIKTVKYWSMRDAGGDFELNDEVDELAWVSVTEAAERTRFPTDRKVLDAFTALPSPTSLLVVVRNGSAVSASRRVAPHKRALDRRGKDQAQALVPLLDTLGITTLLSTAARRCVDTLRPYASGHDTEVQVDESLGTAAGASARLAATRRLLDLVAQGGRVAVCAEGVVADRLVGSLTSSLAGGGAAGTGSDAGKSDRASAQGAGRVSGPTSGHPGAHRRPPVGIRKGSWCLIHVGAGELLSIERPEDM